MDEQERSAMDDHGEVPDEDAGADDEFPEGTERPSAPGGGAQDGPAAAPTRPPSDS
jgi:hypothetical protein